MDGVPGLSLSQRKKNCWIARPSTTVAEPCSEQSSAKEASAFGNSHQPCPGWKRPTSKCYVITNVHACRHNKAFSKSWAFGCNRSKIRALEARCNHTYKHQSIAGVKEQGVYLSTLTAEYPPSLALQLAQVGIGRVSKTGSFRQALPLHSDFSRTITLAPCRLPTCDGAGMHSSADWCCPKPEHPLQAVARPWLHWMHERKLVPRILAHIKSGSQSLEVATLAYTALKLPCPADMSPRQDSCTDSTCCRPWPTLGATQTWPSCHFCNTGYRQEPCQPCHPAFNGRQRSQTPRCRRIWKFVRATGRWPRTSQKPCKACCAMKLPTTGL